MEIKRVGVAGCGLMGGGIAQVCAEAGYPVLVREVSGELLKKGLGRIDSFLARAVEKGKLSEERKQEVLGLIEGTTDTAGFGGCDIVIEAVVESLPEKARLYEELDRVCPEHTLFASNTSSLSITEMAAGSGRPDRFVGLHFFNPVPLMKLVEVVRSPLTSSDAYEAAFAFAEGLGKTPIRTGDKTGFVVNRLLVPYLLDAIRALEEGVASVPDIDEGMRLGCGHPMGPFALLDFVGLDTTYSIANIMFDEFRERRFAPPPLLKRMVQAGMLGKKAGRGFYDYSAKPPTPVAGLV
ncbi:MAG: 3-hydroxyacyl-CoA dehydrogenase family protein [Acidobacteria bacterium]|jgi:3-hydroxybutyryl-CoA dehydrogenase|nr:3-hydroxyacyl-CoA dehydrogenase family protein [Acidobacteriota bacterium]